MVGHVFQSTPDYLNRENIFNVGVQHIPIAVSIHSRLFKPGEWSLMRVLRLHRMFQSTPDYLNRENIHHSWRPQFFQTVSIHSRLFKPGEYNVDTGHRWGNFRRFNPLPII